MGQKTHPKGYGLDVNKDWESNWFSKKNQYAVDLAQDIQLRKYLKKRLQDASVSSINIERTSQSSPLHFIPLDRVLLLVKEEKKLED
ncbi:MAG: hypothetical protein Ct9H300mP24_1020 [Candidatus Neomarinimicrobiota bacterium]|nr:MAG: hypothetical protein Ct9H300mP24_1020 [Candidatus Neomarinimicrobiota bacterium]